MPTSLRVIPASAPGPASESSPEWEARFDAIMREQYATLCTFVQRLVGSPEAAEDVVQDVFITIWQRGLPAEYRTNPRPYLFRAARNRAISHLRHSRARERWHVEAGSTTSESHDHETVRLEAEELSAAIARVVDALPERCRMAFVLHREHGLTYAEIAEVMGISRKTVENQMSRALAVLRRRLAPYLCVGVLVVTRIIHRSGIV